MPTKSTAQKNRSEEERRKDLLDQGRSDIIAPLPATTYQSEQPTPEQLAELDASEVPTEIRVTPPTQTSSFSLKGTPPPAPGSPIFTPEDWTRPTKPVEPPAEFGDLTAPVSMKPAPVTSAPVAPMKDFRGDVADARKTTDLMKLLGQFSQLTDDLNRSFRPNEGQKPSGVAAYLSGLGDTAQARVGEDMKLEEAAYKQRLAQATRDPSSPENRKAQDAFLQISGAPETSALAERVRGMTKEQVDSLAKGQLDFRKQAELERHNAATEGQAAAGLAETQQNNALQGKIGVHNALNKPMIVGMQSGLIDNRKGVDIVKDMQKTLQPLTPAIGAFQRIAKMAGPSLVKGVVPADMEFADGNIGTFNQIVASFRGARRFAPAEALALKQAVTTLSNDLMRIQAGANLTPQEITMWRQVFPSIIEGGPEAQAVALDYFRQRLGGQIRNAQSLAASYEPAIPHFNNWAKISGVRFDDPLWSDDSLVATPQTAEAKAAANAPASSPAASSSGGRQITMKDGSVWEEQSDGAAKMVKPPSN